ncbi:hypothetical protein M436DRAFT_60590 [Aureobasidium namibiae CBS 147.97]|uniref:Uncharacterized protein n=1 Tax=Aureobasidium namibiae CBS 147.97 TaxID=1043004 RepID=A0A074WU90_9PEZI
MSEELLSEFPLITNMSSESQPDSESSSEGLHFSKFPPLETIQPYSHSKYLPYCQISTSQKYFGLQAFTRNLSTNTTKHFALQRSLQLFPLHHKALPRVKTVPNHARNYKHTYNHPSATRSSGFSHPKYFVVAPTTMTSSAQGTSGGRKRRKPNQLSNQTTSEHPGDPANPASFANFFENENKTAAYLGFSHTSDLRRIAVSFPVLRAYIKFEPISSNARSHDSLALLADGVDQYTNVEEPEQKWPLVAGDRSERHNKACRIAAVLVDLKNGLEGLCDPLLSDRNQELQDAAHKDFSKAYPGMSIVNIQHVPTLLSKGQLGPLESESAVEPFNRCYGLLKYFQHQLKAGKNHKNLRDKHGLSRGSPVKSESIPSWMRPKVPGAETIPVNPAVSIADKLSKKSFVALWHKKFDDDELEAALAEKDNEGVDRPDSRQILSTDPRVYTTSMAFRDQLRRQFRCAQLKTTIFKCRLEYKVEDDTHNADVLQGDWHQIKELLNDDKNTECIFKLGFAPLADGEDFSYETDEHPNMEGFLTLQDDAEGGKDMVLDQVALQQRAAALSQQAGSSNEVLPQNPNQEALMKFVDASMTPGKGPHDIGSAPDPSLRFAGNRDLLLKHFDGKDVDDPEQLRLWQQTVLDDIANAVPSTSKTDQPKRGTISKDAEKSLQDAAFFGMIAAEARERRDDGET